MNECRSNKMRNLFIFNLVEKFLKKKKLRLMESAVVKTNDHDSGTKITTIFTKRFKFNFKNFHAQIRFCNFSSLHCRVVKNVLRNA